MRDSRAGATMIATMNAEPTKARWWVESDTFKQRHLAALKRDVAIGIEDLERGRYQTYSDANILQLAEDVGKAGREKLNHQSCRPNERSVVASC
jgi:hypothetical protein